MTNEGVRSVKELKAMERLTKSHLKHFMCDSIEDYCAIYDIDYKDFQWFMLIKLIKKKGHR